MYYSKLAFNTRIVAAQKTLGDRYSMHQAVMRGFEGRHPERVLFRLEATESSLPFILVSSDMQPNWMNLGPSLMDAKVKEVHPHFEQGMNLVFKVMVNPVKTVKGKRVGIYGYDEQAKWLADRSSERWGFDLKDMDITESGRSFSFKGRSEMTFVHNYAVYEGVLQVTKPNEFRLAVERGIGPSKGLGFGMLTVAR